MSQDSQPAVNTQVENQVTDATVADTAVADAAAKTETVELSKQAVALLGALIEGGDKEALRKAISALTDVECEVDEECDYSEEELANMNMYVVCCGVNGRAVLLGLSPKDPKAGKPIRLRNARMVLYWDTPCGGLLGLAANGPKGESRITAAVARHGDECVHQWLLVSPEARKAIDAWPAA